MEGLSFIFILALQMVSLHSQPTAPPPPPTISVSPHKELYWIGDTVTVICTAPPQRHRVDGWRIAAGGGRAVMLRDRNRKCRHTFVIRGIQDGGSYSCAYTVLDGMRRHVTSGESQEVTVNVQPPPPAPILTPSPSPTLLLGSSLSLTCSTPSPPQISRDFRLYRDNQSEAYINITVFSPNQSQATFFIREISLADAGYYGCAYEDRWELGRVQSYLSSSLHVVVIEPPSPPILQLDPPSGLLLDGSQVTLICSTNGSAVAGQNFSFYRDGELLLADGDDMGLSRYRVVGDGGNYSCRYQVDVGGGMWVTSPHSERKEVTVKGSFWSMLLICASAAAILLLLSAILICVYYRRRRGNVNWVDLVEKDEAGAVPMVLMEGRGENGAVLG